MSAFVPAVVAPAPWKSTVEALLWVHPAAPGARAALPRVLVSRAGLPLTIGGLIAYLDGPVGPYDEIFGAPVLLRGGAPLLSHVAFMAVNSAASVAGGRGNWALPKVLATFAAEGSDGVTGRGEDWAVQVTAAVRPRRMPFAAAFACAQVWPDAEVRTFTVRMRGRARLARVAVQHAAPSALGRWLVDGHHLGVAISGVQDVSPAVA